MDSLLAELLDIAQSAAAEIMAVYREPFEVAFKKGPHDPVTIADKRANDLICARLEHFSPGTPIVAEESPESAWGQFRESDKVFFVDPLDGTREFVKKSDQFVVMIGLLQGDTPSHGLLLSPVTGTVWAGSTETPAFKLDREGTRRELRLQPVSSKRTFRAVASRGEPGSLIERCLATLAPSEVVPVHSAGLKGAALVCGDADAYVAPDSAGCRWDSCAPEAIIRAAGGVYTDATGQPLDYRAARLENDAGIIAAAPQLHAQLIRQLEHLMNDRPS